MVTAAIDALGDLNARACADLGFGGGVGVAVNTIYFLPELDAAFSELARTVKPSGRAVVGMGDPEWMAKLPFTEHGFNIRPVAEVVAALESAGLALEEHRRVGDGAADGHLLVVAPV